jgi:hypothetical protein
MKDFSELRALSGKPVELRFVDGHVVHAKIVHVDTDEPLEVIYDVIEVMERGPQRLASVRAGTVASARSVELLDWRAL